MSKFQVGDIILFKHYSDFNYKMIAEVLTNKHYTLYYFSTMHYGNQHWTDDELELVTDIFRNEEFSEE